MSALKTKTKKLSQHSVLAELGRGRAILSSVSAKYVRARPHVNNRKNRKVENVGKTKKCLVKITFLDPNLGRHLI